MRPRAILDIIQAASELRFAPDTSGAPALVPKACTRCGYMTSQVGARMTVSRNMKHVAAAASAPSNIYAVVHRKCAKRAPYWKGLIAGCRASASGE